MSEVKIISLPPERWEEYKELSIEAVKQEPQAFSPTYEEKISYPDTDYEQELKRAQKGEIVLVFAEVEGKLVGMGGASFHKLNKMRHNAFFWNLYVHRDYRGKGIGKLLIEKRIEEIEKRTEIKNILCEIISTQTVSIELHKNLGFEVVGELKDFFNVNGEYVGEYWLQKRI